MKIIREISQWRHIYQSLNKKQPSSQLGFVPTMGNLHDGHASLLERSMQENENTVLSIFVNPTQFNNQADYERYPLTIEEDLEKAKTLGIQYVFIPTKEMLYPDDFNYKIIENRLSNVMEGQARPGHFDGVLTIVLKLFHIIKPNKAYFGEKDRQQLLLIQEMVKAFFLDIEIIGCPIIRDHHGLALSSRNQFLTPEQKVKAQEFANGLKQPGSTASIISYLNNSGFDVEYVQDYGQHRYAAVKIDTVRLIDNIRIEKDAFVP